MLVLLVQGWMDHEARIKGDVWQNETFLDEGLKFNFVSLYFNAFHRWFPHSFRLLPWHTFGFVSSCFSFLLLLCWWYFCLYQYTHVASSFIHLYVCFSACFFLLRSHISQPLWGISPFARVFHLRLNFRKSNCTSHALWVWWRWRERDARSMSDRIAFHFWSLGIIEPLSAYKWRKKRWRFSSFSFIYKENRIRCFSRWLKRFPFVLFRILSNLLLSFLTQG